MAEPEALRSLARAMGVHTRYTDGRGRPVTVPARTLVRVCAALGAPVERPEDAETALRAHEARRGRRGIPPVRVAWDGTLAPLPVPEGAEIDLRLEDGSRGEVEVEGGEWRVREPLPLGYHELTIGTADGALRQSIVSAPVEAWRRPGKYRSWGIAAHLAALRSERSRSLGDLRDLETLCDWVDARGGDVVMVLPLLPTFNSAFPEPSPYSPVSRLFWSELVLDLDAAHRPATLSGLLDVTRADAEVRHALAGRPVPEVQDEELVRYARFRGAQARLGRNWRDWPRSAREGVLASEQVDPAEARFHLVAQTLVRRQLAGLRDRVGERGLRLALDLAVGVHPDGYDSWSRSALFAEGMSVGAPPDAGFPSGQDWGFPPVLPEASRREGHRYLAASIAHQMTLAGVVRVDHIMACARLYWIPHGFGKHEGTYVTYPLEELLALLTLESHRHRCEVVGENLGTVPPEIDEALPRHRIWGMYLAEFEAGEDPTVPPPGSTDAASVGTHDTPTLAGWMRGIDIEERLRCGLLEADAASEARAEREAAVAALAARLDREPADAQGLLEALLRWLGGSESPLVLAWLEDLWLEEEGVNIPGTRSSERPNWQRPMRRLLDDALSDPEIERLIGVLESARHAERRGR